MVISDRLILLCILCLLTDLKLNFPGGDPAAAIVLHCEPAAAQYFLDGDGRGGFLPATRQWREGFLQDHFASGLLCLSHHCI